MGKVPWLLSSDFQFYKAHKAKHPELTPYSFKTSPHPPLNHASEAKTVSLGTKQLMLFISKYSLYLVPSRLHNYDLCNRADLLSNSCPPSPFPSFCLSQLLSHVSEENVLTWYFGIVAPMLYLEVVLPLSAQQRLKWTRGQLLLRALFLLWSKPGRCWWELESKGIWRATVPPCPWSRRSKRLLLAT